MQMSRMYEKVNKRVRANGLRQDALECRRAGFSTIADINEELAELLDPTPIETPSVTGEHRKHGRGVRKGSRTGTGQSGENSNGVSRGVSKAVNSGGSGAATTTGITRTTAQYPRRSEAAPVPNRRHQVGVNHGAKPIGRPTHPSNHRRGTPARA